jgi:TfoX/Sxy family transcriptional regulator of competence genes
MASSSTTTKTTRIPPNQFVGFPWMAYNSIQDSDTLISVVFHDNLGEIPMGKTAKMPPEDKIELYDRLIASHPEIERKGKTNPYTSLNGHMFSHLSKEGVMGLRLPKEERERFLETYGTTLYEQYGAIMKEYVKVPDELLENTEELKKYLETSLEYIKSLKPKPTKKKKS